MKIIRVNMIFHVIKCLGKHLPLKHIFVTSIIKKKRDLY